MKNNDNQELKPVYIQELNSNATDDISLVDLALILLRHKTMIFSIITISIAIAITAALLIPKKYTYSTSIEIGSQIINGTAQAFESPETLLAKIQYSFAPQILNTHRQENKEDKKRYKIDISIPKSSAIIILKTMGTENDGLTIKKLLREISLTANNDHKKIYDSIEQNLNAQKERAESQLKALDITQQNTNEKERLLRSDIATFESKLAYLRETREILPPLRSPEPTGVSKKLLIIAITSISIFIAICVAFLSEFVSIVRRKDISNK